MTLSYKLVFAKIDLEFPWPNLEVSLFSLLSMEKIIKTNRESQSLHIQIQQHQLSKQKYTSFIYICR